MGMSECPNCKSIILEDELSCFSCGYLLVPIDHEINILHKKATELKKANEIDRAIEILVNVVDLMKQSELQYSMEKFVRLPLYLQQANRFDEALLVFDDFVEYFSSLKMKGFGDYSESKTARFQHSYLSSLYKSKALACKRNKRFDLEKESIVMVDYYEKQSDMYRILSDDEDKLRFEKHKEKLNKMGNIKNSGL